MNLHNPTAEDIVKASKEFSLHPLVSEGLLRPSLRPRSDSYDSHLYFVLYFPLSDPDRHSLRSKEIDIVVGKNFLLTVHYDTMRPLADFFDSCDLNLAVRDQHFDNPSALLYALWSTLYESIYKELERIQSKVDRIEERIFIFKDNEKTLIKDISYLRRDILDFLRAVRTHESVLEALRGLAPEFFGDNFLDSVRKLLSSWRRIMSLSENNKDALETLYETNNSFLTHRTNEIVKMFTMLALFTFPLSLIATVFSIDAAGRPIVGDPNDFWIIVGILIAVIFLMYGFFKYRHWI